LSKKSIIFLGTASSIPNLQRFTQSIAVCSTRDCVLLDAGEGVQIRLASAGIDHRSVKIVALSHIHGDHIHGLLPFIESLAMKISSQRSESRFILKVVAPRSLCRYLSNTLNIIKVGDIDKVVYIDCIEAGPASRDGVFIESPGKDIVLLPIPVDHGLEESYGYFIKVKLSKNILSIYYSGDGICREQCLKILKMLKPLLIIHEATFLDYVDEKMRAIESYHSTVSDAAKIANEVGAHILILTHMSARYRDDELKDFISRAKRIFTGEVFVAEDLAKIPLDFIKL